MWLLDGEGGGASYGNVVFGELKKHHFMPFLFSSEFENVSKCIGLSHLGLKRSGPGRVAMGQGPLRKCCIW